METNKGVETLYAKDRHVWREWLEVNSQSETEVYLIMYHKKSGTESINHEEAVEEAMCFGWIDSLRNKRDHESFYQRFSPRKPRSNWSERSKETAQRMINTGLMTDEGLRVMEVAKNNGKWESK